MCLLEEHPDWYLREFAAKFNVCHQAMHIMFEILALHVKKTFTYSEKSGKDREEFLNKIAGISEGKRVYYGNKMRTGTSI